jgi:hypothetical protein
MACQVKPFYFEIINIKLLIIINCYFRLGATIPDNKSHTSSGSAKMDVEDEEHVHGPSCSHHHHHHEEPPKVESEPESDLG